MVINAKARATGMLVFTTVAWGAMFAIAKSALHALDAFWLSALRYVPAAALMLALLAFVEGRRALSPDGETLKLWRYGSLGFAGFSILGFLGLSQSRPEHAAIIVTLMPLVTALMQWILHGRRPDTTTLVATLVAFAGVLLVITKGRPLTAAEGTLHADALVFAGMVCWVLYTMGAQALPQFSPLRYTAHSMAFGALTIVVVTMVASAVGFAPPPAARDVASFSGQIAYLALVGGVLAVLAWNAGIGMVGPANGVLFINLVPITAFAIGIAQGHRLGGAEAIGVVLVIGSLVVSNVASRPGRRLASRPKFA